MKILRTPEEWNRGLRGFALDEAALFIMHQTAPWPITMDGLMTPLDVYWLSESGMVLEHAELFPGMPTYWPDAAGKFVLEMPMQEAPIYKVGDFVELPE